MNSDRIQSIANAVLTGNCPSAELSHWATLFWNRGDFYHMIRTDQVDIACASGESMPRYAGTAEVHHRILYGAKGQPGCVEVDAPPERHDFGGDLNRLRVVPHSHPSDHIAIVLEGDGVFVVKRQVQEADVMLTIPTRAGSILFYPAGIPHTFITGENGIRVASAQAEYESPASVRFADRSPEYLNELPRLEQQAYERTLSLGPQMQRFG